MTNTHDEAVATKFSTDLRRATWSDHESAETRRFMQALLHSELSLQQYGSFTTQLFFIYSAIEEASLSQGDDPVGSQFLFPEFVRKSALEQDMAFYHGDDWRNVVKPLPTTEKYVARINEVAPKSGGAFLAHHYTRYMGDLSGGTDIRKVGETAYGLTSDGISFYQFPLIDDGVKFKARYRERIDGLDIDAAEKARIIDEITTAYALNIAVLDELSRTQFPA